MLCGARSGATRGVRGRAEGRRARAFGRLTLRQHRPQDGAEGGAAAPCPGLPRASWVTLRGTRASLLARVLVRGGRRAISASWSTAVAHGQDFGRSSLSVKRDDRPSTRESCTHEAVGVTDCPAGLGVPVPCVAVERSLCDPAFPLCESGEQAVPRKGPRSVCPGTRAHGRELTHAPSETLS